MQMHMYSRALHTVLLCSTLLCVGPRAKLSCPFFVKDTDIATLIMFALMFRLVMADILLMSRDYLSLQELHAGHCVQWCGRGFVGRGFTSSDYNWSDGRRGGPGPRKSSLSDKVMVMVGEQAHAYDYAHAYAYAYAYAYALP